MRTPWILLSLALIACRNKDVVDTGDCVEQTFYVDQDGDGYGSDEVLACALEAPYVANGGDCDDEDPLVNPGALERCNSLDDNCDGQADEDLSGTFYVDEDQDGYGDAAVEECDGSGLASEGGDCDDTDATLNPGAVEVCDGIDNDCDTLVDDDDDSLDQGSAERFHADTDADGYGDATSFVLTCEAPEGYVADATDCDDSTAARSPAELEICDGLDNDCDGQLPADEQDVDGDGYTECVIDSSGWAGDSSVVGGEDCDDADGTSWPAADEQCDGVDHDCDGEVYDDDAVDQSVWYRDSDNDGDGDTAATTEDCLQPSGYVANDLDCDDSDDTVYDGATELCDGLDNDCDGTVPADEGDDDGDFHVECTLDADGWDGGGSIVAGDDCDDSDSDQNPSASEVCDGDDEDCDGVADNGVLGSGASCAAEDCLEILVDQPTATDGTYTLTNGTYTCDMTTDGGGWTRVGSNHPLYGTGYNSTSYNNEGFEFGEIFFEYASGSTHGHCTYPGSMTGCVPWGFKLDSSGWYGPKNWGSSTCGMSVSSAFGSYTTLSGYDVFIDYETQAGTTSTALIRAGMLEGISGCTTSDNYGTAYMHVWLR
jgi:hypothetical protein